MTTTPVLLAQDQEPAKLSHGAQLASDLEAPDLAGKSGEPELGAPEVDETPESSPPLVPSVVKPEDELQELRGIVRSLSRQNADLKSQFTKMRQVQEAPSKVAPKGTERQDFLEDVFGEPKAPVTETPAAKAPPTQYEQLQQGLQYIGQTKGPLLETLVATMEMNSKYTDIRDVCSRNNFDDIIEAAAQRYVGENGGDLVEAQMAIELAIWNKPNPYQYMYDVIKTTHRKYAAAAKPAGEAQPGTPAKAPVIAPTSIVSLGGGEANPDAGWTDKKIDSLEDEEYAKLPQKVRDLYLAGELPKG